MTVIAWVNFFLYSAFFILSPAGAFRRCPFQDKLGPSPGTLFWLKWQNNLRTPESIKKLIVSATRANGFREN